MMYAGGPLDGQVVAGAARSVYRDAAGKPVPASWGDRRRCWRRWQPGETGLYARQHASYEWRDRNDGKQVAA